MPQLLCGTGWVTAPRPQGVICPAKGAGQCPPKHTRELWSRGALGRPSSPELLHARGQAASPGAGPQLESGMKLGSQLDGIPRLCPTPPTDAHPEKLP